MICCFPKALTRTHPVLCSGFVPVCIRIPLRFGTPHTSGRIFLNLGDIVFCSSYVPSGMMYSAFSNVAHNIASAPIGMVAVPCTALPFRLTRRISIVAMLVPIFIGVVYPEQGSCKGCNLAKPDEQRLMNLTMWLYEDPAEQQHQPSDRQNRSGD